MTKKGEAVFIDATIPSMPPRQNKSKMVIDKELDVRTRLKKDKTAKVMSLDAEEYKKYKGKDDGLVIDEPKKKLTPEQAMDNAIGQYMNDREQYDGKFNPEENDDGQGYDRYKKIYVRTVLRLRKFLRMQRCSTSSERKLRNKS